jgi:GntR family transcriptional regulator
VDVIAGPSWDAIAKDIRARIRSGEYPVGEPIPSTPKLMDQYDVSKGPVRQAIDVLRSEGVLAGRPGKGVYVTGTPAAEDGDLAAIVAQVRDMDYRITEIYQRLGWEQPAPQEGKADERTG